MQYMKTKSMTLYYQVTKDKIEPASVESLERKNQWIREMQKEVPSEWDPIILKITYRISNREVERLRKFFNGPVVEYWIIQATELYDGRPDSQTKKRARETLLYQALGYEVELMDGKKERARKSTADFTDTQEWNDFLQTLQETEFEPNGYEFPDSKEFWELCEKHGYTKAHEISVTQLQKRLQKKST